MEAIGYVAKGTRDELAYERAASVTLTYEGLSGGVEPDRLARHAALWEQIFSHLNRTN